MLYPPVADLASVLNTRGSNSLDSTPEDRDGRLAAIRGARALISHPLPQLNCSSAPFTTTWMFGVQRDRASVSHNCATFKHANPPMMSSRHFQHHNTGTQHLQQSPKPALQPRPCCLTTSPIRAMNRPSPNHPSHKHTVAKFSKPMSPHRVSASAHFPHVCISPV
ncbi:hypothetical protein K458DRAFT_59853 [Lentithecium fluviatile CBS 122367]|uniref:Uncharacterized protein n=1 Tax=Lentithecium fluviatile CBS 122367 TaxID=1168545 RepID=A0A6G1IX17_9PLEO|nr:hypothetical protein K458DRAFT_59853 [Lentithecium fluviatile CBS 122367]